jgi:4,5-DOPA dioxygenase extradiol
MMPTLFLSHGSPALPLTESPARDFLTGLGNSVVARSGRPNAILVASAHWETRAPAVSAPAVNTTIHDFHGFPPALYQMHYDPPPAPALADRVAGLLRAAGATCSVDRARGLDHGAWVPLMLMYPSADIPVAQISLQHGGDATYHYRLGQALAALRREGVLVVGSGSFTHDLSEFRPSRGGADESEPHWVTGFADWVADALAERRIDDLLAYRRLAPFAVKNHPSEEHFLPLFVAMGAAGPDAAVEHLHASVTHRVLRMDVYGFA